MENGNSAQDSSVSMPATTPDVNRLFLDALVNNGSMFSSLGWVRICAFRVDGSIEKSNASSVLLNTNLSHEEGPYTQC